MGNTLQHFATPANVKPVQGDNNLTSDVTNILNGVIAVLGLACVVVMIVGGVNYMTSNGDTSKTEKGKKTILYGLIGLIICALSFTIVNFAISDILNAKSSGGGGEENAAIDADAAKREQNVLKQKDD